MLNRTARREYFDLRAKQWPASNAFGRAKVVGQWEELGGYGYDNMVDKRTGPDDSALISGPVRLVIEPDECVSYEDMDGDTFDPRCHPDIPAERLEREQKEEHDRMDRDGIWGLCGQYWNGEEWIDTDSTWGFVGQDWERSGYDDDIMHATMAKYHTAMSEQAGSGI